MVDSFPQNFDKGLDKSAIPPSDQSLDKPVSLYLSTASAGGDALAEAAAIAAASTERLRDNALHHSLSQIVRPPADLSQETEKTLAGKAVGAAWDLLAGRGQCAADRSFRAHKADEYAEIAADTFASIPKFGALAGGIARSVLLIDVSGQKSAAGIARGMAFNFLEGAALNGVSRMASSESAVGRMVSSRLGAGITAEVATHAISGAGFGLVKTGMSEQSWYDAQGRVSLSSGLKNMAIGTSTGALIGVPAGMAGLRVGKAVTFGLSAQLEHSAVASSVQKIATGAGSGFASGAVFGGVDAARGGKSVGQIIGAGWQGGLVGLATGGLSAGFDRTAPLARLPLASAEHARLGQIESLAVAASGGLREVSAGRRDTQPSAVGDDAARDTRGISQTQKMLDRSDQLSSDEARRAAFERFIYQPRARIAIEDFSGRLQAPRIEARPQARLKADAPQTSEAMQAAMEKIRRGAELDFGEHFWKPFTESLTVPMRIYKVEGHTARIVVPESYAVALDEVRGLRAANEKPTAYDRLTLADRAAVAAIMKSGDASGLSRYMNASEVTEYIKVYQAGLKLLAHPLQARALPEDMIPILDALPNRNLVKEVLLLDSRSVGDLFSAVRFKAPGFQAAATVEENGTVRFFQANHGTRLYNTTFHEWAHLAKWASPPFSKLFDLSSVVDSRGMNIDHQATADARRDNPAQEPVTKLGQYYPDLHSTRNQDENWAVGLGEEMLGTDPTSLFSYVNQAPVRAMTLASALEAQVAAAGKESASTLVRNLKERAEHASDVVRPYALGSIQERLRFGNAEEKAAAAQLMVHFGTPEQSGDLLAAAIAPGGDIVPTWKDTAAQAHMASDSRTVAQHAFDGYLALNGHTESARLDAAMRLVVSEPQYRDVVLDYARRTSDPRGADLALSLKHFNAEGSLAERAVAINLIRQFGGADRAEQLLEMALAKKNRERPESLQFKNSGSWMERIGERGAHLHDSAARSMVPGTGGTKTVAQRAYDAYIDVSARSPEARIQMAFDLGLSKPNHRDLAANYLIGSYSERARAYGNFLEIHDLPGHVSQMQSLIVGGLRADAPTQKLVFDQMMKLTDADPRKQMELLQANFEKVPSLRNDVLIKMESVLQHGATSVQRRQIGETLASTGSAGDISGVDPGRIEALTKRLNQDAKLEEAIMLMRKGQNDRILGVHELSALHDQRAIKPLLQQAVSNNSTVSQEAIGALRQYSPALVKYYAQELKREYFSNPVMTGKISDLLNSHRLSASQ
ncbi:MAG: hypothetical protein KGS72_27250 [Cyanobacteria bacterium REEB67]|nr:hypothetical protein [Cyanobacteria bacterium REEB67]